MSMGRQTLPRFTPYTSSDDDSDHVVVRKKAPKRPQPQKVVPQNDKPPATVVETEVHRPSRLKRYLSRHFDKRDRLTASMSSTTLDNVDELRTVQSTITTPAVPAPMRHSKSVGDLHLHLPSTEQGLVSPAGEKGGQTLLRAPSKAQPTAPNLPPMIQMGDKGPSAARDMAALGFKPESRPQNPTPSPKTQDAKSPKSTMQRLEEKFATWFASKKATKTRKTSSAPTPDKKKIIPTKSSSSSVSSTLLLDSSSSNENPKKPKKKRVDFVLVHKQVESLFHDKKPAASKSAPWSFARLRENMSTSEITPEAPQLPPLNLGSPSPHNSTNNINLHKATTSITSDPATLFPESDMTSEDEEAHWNDGYRLWKERRNAWLTPHPEYLQEMKEKEEAGEDGIQEPESSETAKFEDIPEEGYPMVYERLVDKTKTLKKPLNLAFVLKVMKAGWVATGQWPSSG